MTLLEGTRCAVVKLAMTFVVRMKSVIMLLKMKKEIATLSQIVGNFLNFLINGAENGTSYKVTYD